MARRRARDAIDAEELLIGHQSERLVRADNLKIAAASWHASHPAPVPTDYFAEPSKLRKARKDHDLSRIEALGINFPPCLNCIHKYACLIDITAYEAGKRVLKCQTCYRQGGACSNASAGQQMFEEWQTLLRTMSTGSKDEIAWKEKLATHEHKKRIESVRLQKESTDRVSLVESGILALSLINQMYSKEMKSLEVQTQEALAATSAFEAEKARLETIRAIGPGLLRLNLDKDVIAEMLLPPDLKFRRNCFFRTSPRDRANPASENGTETQEMTVIRDPIFLPD